MRSIRIITTLALLLTWATAYAEEDSVSAFQTENDDNTERLWYDTPAKIWLEALPIGNGRLGGMVYGGPQTDEIQLNEDSFWSGGPHNNNSTTSAKNLDRCETTSSVVRSKRLRTSSTSSLSRGLMA